MWLPVWAVKDNENVSREAWVGGREVMKWWQVNRTGKLRKWANFLRSLTWWLLDWPKETHLLYFGKSLALFYSFSVLLLFSPAILKPYLSYSSYHFLCDTIPFWFERILLYSFCVLYLNWYRSMRKLTWLIHWLIHYRSGFSKQII